MKKPSGRIREIYLDLAEANQNVDVPESKETLMIAAILMFLDERYYDSP